MGQEIYYCSVCHTQLRSADFEKRKAFKLELEAVCATCVPDALKSLSPEKQEGLRNILAGTSVKPAASTPKTGTARIPLASPASSGRIVPAPEGNRGLTPILVAAAVTVAILVCGIYALSNSRPEHAPGSKTPATIATEIPSPTPEPETRRLQIAKDSLRKANLYADAHPTEYLEQIRLFEEAVTEAKGTGFDIDVSKALEGVKRRMADAGAAELKALDQQTQDASAKEEFQGAKKILDEARKKPITSDWSGEIDRRLQELQGRMDSAYGRIRAQAVLATPGSVELESLKRRVAKWGREELLADLDRALADAARPKPEPAPLVPPPPTSAPAPQVQPRVEAEALGKSWTASLGQAYGRDFPSAIQELERLVSVLQDPVQKSRAARDLETLRDVGALHAEANQALTRWPAGKKIALGYLDFDNRPQHIEGPFVLVHAGTIEITRGRSSAQLPLGHLTIRSLIELAPGRKRVTAAIACLIEGELQGAKELAGEGASAIPEPYWTWGAEVAKAPDEETQKQESNARYGYYFSVLNQGSPALRAEAALRCRKILEEHPSLTWVRRNRAMLLAVAETTRDYVAGPASLRPSGMFRLEVPKTTPYWMSSIDIDPARRKDNYVEMEYSVLTDATYRAWAYIGACCSESLVFYAQGNEMAGAEPGSEAETPLKHPITSATKTHAGHSGRKGPSKWAWVEIPLPKYEKPGPKVLRLLSGSQGFSVAWIVVSSLRDRPPGDLEVRDWDRDLLHSAGPVGPTIGLAAWYKVDAGVVIEGGRVAQWQDQSGRGHHAIQVNPTARPLLVASAVNTKPALRFDGASSVLTFDCPVNGIPAITIFLVASASKNQRSNELGNYAALEWPEFGPWGNIFVSPQQTCVAWRFGTGQFGNVSFWERPNEAPKGPTVTTVRKDGAKEELFVQGLVVWAAKDKLLSIAHTQDAGTIGAGNDSKQNPLRFYPGDIAEILVFTRSLSDAERDAVERYLRSKYGI